MRYLKIESLPSAKEWMLALDAKEKPVWMTRTLDINVD